MAANCDECEHRGPNECRRGRTLFPLRCGWWSYAKAIIEEEAEWDREVAEWEADEEGESDE